MLSFDEHQQLDEKAILFQQGKNYGQVVFLAGGAASGKGFALDNFMQPEKFKVRDVDEWKKALMKLDAIAAETDNKYKQKGIDTKAKFGVRASDLNLKNEEDVFRLHDMVDQLGWKEKTLDLLLSGAKNPDRLPNIIFDITMKNLNQVSKNIPMLLSLGYKPENIHLVWILTNFNVALDRNRTRPRKVPEYIVKQTHTGAATTMMNIVRGNIPRGMNGRITVVLNNNEETIFYLDKEGNKTNLVKSFTSIDLKKEGKKFENNSFVNAQIHKWVTKNAPKEVIKDIKDV
jgi:predicted kinase